MKQQDEMVVTGEALECTVDVLVENSEGKITATTVLPSVKLENGVLIVCPPPRYPWGGK